MHSAVHEAASPKPSIIISSLSLLCAVGRFIIMIIIMLMVVCQLSVDSVCMCKTHAIASLKDSGGVLFCDIFAWQRITSVSPPQ